VWEKRQIPAGTRLDAFFANAEFVFTAARKEPAVREFLVRLFTRPAMDLGLVKQIQGMLTAQPWVDAFVRGIYALPPKEKLEVCLGNLLVMGSVQSRWTDLEKDHLLPPFLALLKGGQIVSPERLKLARAILDEPDLLPVRSARLRTWSDLVMFVTLPETIPEDTPEYLRFVRDAARKLDSGAATGYLSAVGQLTCMDWVLGVVFAFVGLGLLAGSGRRHEHTYSRERACYANMRVILGAVEMYNMDNAVMMTGIDMPALLSGNYLRNSPQAPEQGCAPLRVTDDLTRTGRIVCPNHGTVEDGGN